MFLMWAQFGATEIEQSPIVMHFSAVSL